MPQNSIGIRWGYSDGTSIKVVAHSLSSSNVTITVNGADTVLSSMTGLGADSGTAKTEAFFYDSATISGLTALTEYSYTATQDGNSITGSFTTGANSDDSDFVFFAGTCDSIVTNNNNVTNSGMYSLMRTYMSTATLPVVGLLHIDDHYGYMPANDVDDSAGTGHKITSGNSAAWESGKTYDYALAVGAAHGLYSTSGNNWCLAGHDEDRTWAMRNIPMWPQKGDWDAGYNEMSWSISKTDTTTVTNPTYKDMYDNSLLVWNAVLKPLQPPAIDGANSNAWGFDIGCMHITAADAITTGSGDATGFNDAPTTIFGSTQIASILSDVAGSGKKFTALALANGIRHLSATPQQYKSGAQNPLNLHATEYPALFTDAGSLMALPETNGVKGTFFTLHGDYHSLKRQKNENATGTNNEWFYSFNLGTLTGSTNMDNSVGSSTYDGSTVEYQEGTFAGNEYWCWRIEVYGSRYPKEVHMVPMDANGDIAGQTRKFVAPRGGNDIHTTDTDLSLFSSVSTSEL